MRVKAICWSYTPNGNVFRGQEACGDPRKAGPRTGIIRAAHASPVAVFRTNHGRRCPGRFTAAQCRWRHLATDSVRITASQFQCEPKLDHTRNQTNRSQPNLYEMMRNEERSCLRPGGTAGEVAHFSHRPFQSGRSFGAVPAARASGYFLMRLWRRLTKAPPLSSSRPSPAPSRSGDPAPRSRPP